MTSEMQTALQAVGAGKDIQSISQALKSLRNFSVEGDHPLFARWLSETPPEEASKAVLDAKVLNEALDVIFSQLATPDPVRDRAASLLLLDQFIAISNEILKNSLVKSQPQEAKKILDLLEKFEQIRA